MRCQFLNKLLHSDVFIVSLKAIVVILLQFVLKHAEWQNMREMLRYPSSICPSHPNTLPLVKEMLDQVIKQSPEIQFIHIGSDEVP